MQWTDFESFFQKMPVFTFMKATLDPGDYFDITARVPSLPLSH